jgi:hypothetical protein
MTVRPEVTLQNFCGRMHHKIIALRKIVAVRVKTVLAPAKKIAALLIRFRAVVFSL